MTYRTFIAVCIIIVLLIAAVAVQAFQTDTAETEIKTEIGTALRCDLIDGEIFCVES